MFKPIQSVISGVGKISDFISKIEKKNRREQKLNNYLQEIDEDEIKLYLNDKVHIAEVYDFNKKYFGSRGIIKWNMLYSIITEFKSVQYIPEDVFVNYIDRGLNETEHLKAFLDKNLLDIIFADLKRPQTYLRAFKGEFLDKDYRQISDETAKKIIQDLNSPLILKPVSDTGSGKGVIILNPQKMSDIFSFIKNRLNSRSPSFIIQECIKQHPELSKWNRDSVNTIKIMTYRFKDEIVHLMSRLRIGMEGQIIDQGGYNAGILKDGTIRIPVVDSKMKKYRHHKETGISFQGEKIPSFDKAVEFCKKAHKRLIHFDIVSWDVAINEQSVPVLIELNIGSQDIVNMQLVNGPLFGSKTEQILSQLRINRTFNI